MSVASYILEARTVKQGPEILIRIPRVGALATSESVLVCMGGECRAMRVRKRTRNSVYVALPRVYVYRCGARPGDVLRVAVSEEDGIPVIVIEGVASGEDRG